MTPQQYLEEILSKYNLSDSDEQSIRNKRLDYEQLLKKHFPGMIASIYYSGSVGKKTAISPSFDLDLCIYYKEGSFNTLKEMYTKTRDVVKLKGSAVEERNVSIKIPQGRGIDIDIVPARIISSTKPTEANLYARLKDSSIKTDIPGHIKLISESQCRPIIKLMKIWKYQNNLQFKSFGLELLTIEALKNYQFQDYGDGMWHVLHYIKNNVKTIKLTDPVNSNNIVSDDITTNEKEALRSAAEITIKRAQEKNSWAEVVK